MTTDALVDVDLTDLDNFTDGFPHHLFERHRAEAPVWWHEPTSHTPDGEGFWSVATHAEVLEVLSDPRTYSSERGGDRPYGGTLIQDLPVAGVVLNMMDDPRHAFAPAAKNLRALGRRRAGRPLADAVAHRLDEWLQMLDRRNLVVAYDPEMPPNEASPTYGGWHYVPREPRDGDDVIRRPDPPTK